MIVEFLPPGGSPEPLEHTVEDGVARIVLPTGDPVRILLSALPQCVGPDSVRWLVAQPDEVSMGDDRALLVGASFVSHAHPDGGYCFPLWLEDPPTMADLVAADGDPMFYPPNKPRTGTLIVRDVALAEV